MNKIKTALRKKADSLFSKAIIARDVYCFLCGLRACDAHHIIPKSLSEYLRYDMQNGIGVCRNDHSKLESHNPFALEALARKLGEERIRYLEMHRRNMLTINQEYLERNVEILTEELKKWTSH